MIKFINKILFIVVLIVILLHAIIPHDQNIDLDRAGTFMKHEKSESIIDLFKVVFHKDANGNLDNLSNNTHNYDISFDFFVFSGFIVGINYLISTEKKTQSSIFNKEFSIYTNGFIVFLNGLRGPPSLI